MGALLREAGKPVGKVRTEPFGGGTCEGGGCWQRSQDKYVDSKERRSTQEGLMKAWRQQVSEDSGEGGLLGG